MGEGIVGEEKDAWNMRAEEGSNGKDYSWTVGTFTLDAAPEWHPHAIFSSFINKCTVYNQDSILLGEDLGS